VRARPRPQGSERRRSIERTRVIGRTAFVSTYPPRRDGIATYTRDLAAATGDREIAVLLPPERGTPFPLEVHHRIRRDQRDDYAHTARALGACVDVVSIQHDYHIWGGEDGEYVFDFLRALEVPVVATLHTILAKPTTRQRTILSDLIASVDATVVMSKAAATLLTTGYGVDKRRLNVIPHGVPDLPLADPAILKAALGLEGREVILSFGLLGPEKGYELAIDALPAVVAAHPNVAYVIVGATQPDLVVGDGEAYRAALVARVKALGMTKHVRFVDDFVGRVEMTRWLQAADVFVTTYPRLDQMVSGTLSYAMGAGRAIVSTPYAYAAELLADGRGILVPAKSPAPLAAALKQVLGDDALRTALGRKAYEYSRRMVWSEVGAQHRALFERVGAAASAAQAAPLGYASLNA
jgi:glycosyltransferase involved in cell wall biosynthesis